MSASAKLLQFPLGRWLPIASVPKGGLVDLWASGQRFTNCYWDCICSEWRCLSNRSPGFCIVHVRAVDATHWMPIPEAPRA